MFVRSVATRLQVGTAIVLGSFLQQVEVVEVFSIGGGGLGGKFGTEGTLDVLLHSCCQVFAVEKSDDFGLQVRILQGELIAETQVLVLFAALLLKGGRHSVKVYEYLTSLSHCLS